MITLRNHGFREKSNTDVYLTDQMTCHCLSKKKKKKKSAKDLYSASATDNEHDTPRNELESVFTS